MKNRTFWLVPIIGLLVLTLTGCGMRLGNGSSEPAPTPTVTATAKNQAGTDSSNKEKAPAVSDELKALLDASRAPSNIALKIVKAHGDTIINGVYALSVPPAMVGDGKVVVKFGDPDALQWSDSESFILVGNTPEELKENLLYAIATEPIVGVSLCHLFAHDPIILDAQSTDWLEECNVPTSELNDLVAEFVPLLFVDEPTDAQYLEASTASKRYQVLASKLIMLLSHYELGTNKSLDSHFSYHLLGGGLSADQVPEIRTTTALDNRPALWFYLTEKTACVPISVLGFNLGDKRPMLADMSMTCEELTAPPTTQATPPSCEELGTCGGEDSCTNCGGEPPCTTCGSTPPGKTGPVPAEPGEKPAPAPSTPAEPVPPVVVVPNDPFVPPIIDTETSLEDEGGGSPTGVVVTD